MAVFLKNCLLPNTIPDTCRLFYPYDSISYKLTYTDSF